MAQSTASGTSSRRYMREHDVSVPSSSRYVDSDWETKEVIVYYSLFLLLNYLFHVSLYTDKITLYTYNVLKLSF